MSDRAEKLLAEIERSRAEFESEFNARAEWLAYRAHCYVVIDGPDAEGVTRMAVHYRKTRRRYERRFGKSRMRTPITVRADEADWRAHEWQLDESERPRSNLFNASQALRHDAALAGLIALDETTNKIMLKAPLPLSAWDFGREFQLRRMKDDDVTSLLEYLQLNGLPLLSRDDCLAAVRLVARENAWSGER